MPLLLKGNRKWFPAGKNGKKKNHLKVYKTIKRVSNGGCLLFLVEQAQDQIIQQGTKGFDKPTLDFFDQVDKRIEAQC